MTIKSPFSYGFPMMILQDARCDGPHDGAHERLRVCGRIQRPDLTQPDVYHVIYIKQYNMI